MPISPRLQRAVDDFADCIAGLRRVETETGSHIEPPLDQDWSNLDKLRWHLAVALHDAGAPLDLISVHEGDLRISGQRVESYDLRWRGGTTGGGDFHAMWSQINGICLGLQLGRRG